MRRMQRLVHGHARLARPARPRPNNGHLLVVHQVLPHPRQVFDQRDIELFQVCRVADPTQLQQLRRVEGTARDDDLAPGEGGELDARRVSRSPGVACVEGLAKEELDARGARGGSGAAAFGGRVEEDAGGQRGERYGKVGAGPDGLLDVVARAVAVAVTVLMIDEAVDA